MHRNPRLENSRPAHSVFRVRVRERWHALGSNIMEWRMTRWIGIWMFAMLASTEMVSNVLAEDWPGWRGPRGDGTVAETNVPTVWDATTGKNILWRSEIPGTGHSSPIVWKDRVFLTTCLEAEQERLLLCLDARDGRELWRRSVLTSPLESRHQLNSYASGTPVTDGRLIYVTFMQVEGDEKILAPNVGAPREITPGSILLAAFDLDGNEKWRVTVGEFISAHGFCSCPVLYDDLVILNGDHDGESYLVALNKSTGQEVWRASREYGVRSYVTPIIRKVDGKDQLVLSGSMHVSAFEPADGRRLWKVEGPTEQFVASPVFDGQRFMLAAGFPTHHVMAIDPSGSGSPNESQVAWHVDKYVKCYVPSPVLVGNRLFVADDRGTASCFDSRNGDRIWQGRVGSGFRASLVATNQSVYFLDNAGRMIVIDAERFETIAENELGENCSASPAISNGRIFLRGEQHLFCIAEGAAAGGS